MTMNKFNHYANSSEKMPNTEEALEDCLQIIEMGIRNQFSVALARAERWSSVSLFHSQTKTCLLAVKAALSLEKEHIFHALDVAKQGSELCDKYRKQQSIAGKAWNLIAKTDYTKYTEEQLHAEIIKAVNHLIVGLLTLFSDQSISTLVKAVLRLQSGHSLLKSCLEISRQNIKWPSKVSELTFLSALKLGHAIINLVLSHLPEKVIMMLSYVGFSGDRELAYKLFDESIQLEFGSYCIIAKLTRCLYETIVVNVIGARKVDLNKISVYANKELDLCDQSAWFLLIKAQILKFTGDLNSAIVYYHKCIEAQCDLKEMHHICYWDLSTVHGFRCEWDLAEKYADLLFQYSNWSKAIFMYMKAAFLYMKMIDEDKPELKNGITEMFRLVPNFKVRFAGKTIPPEKYVCVNAEKYFRDNESLPLPAIDIFYTWNIFAMTRLNPKLLEPLLERIEKVIPGYLEDSTKENGIENYLIVLFFKGVCLKFNRQYSKAERCFKEVIKNEKQIKEEKHLLPMASLEMGLTKLNAKSYSDAEVWLKRAKTYSGYLFELVISMKIHTALQRLKEIDSKDYKCYGNDECI